MQPPTPHRSSLLCPQRSSAKALTVAPTPPPQFKSSPPQQPHTAPTHTLKIYRVHTRLKQAIKAYRVRPEFHRATVRFVAESTGQQVSSCLLGMKSANALLELPPAGNVIRAGTTVVAIIVAKIIGFSRTTSLPSLNQVYVIDQINSTDIDTRKI